MSQPSAFAPAQAGRAAPLFAALGDATRLRLVARLSASGPESITRLCADGAVTRQAIRKHLGVLARAGLAEAQKRGRECIDLISRQWDGALARLKDLVER